MVSSTSGVTHCHVASQSVITESHYYGRLRPRCTLMGLTMPPFTRLNRGPNGAPPWVLPAGGQLRMRPTSDTRVGVWRRGALTGPGLVWSFGLRPPLVLGPRRVERDAPAQALVHDLLPRSLRVSGLDLPCDRPDQLGRLLDRRLAGPDHLGLRRGRGGDLLGRGRCRGGLRSCGGDVHRGGRFGLCLCESEVRGG